jgi:hypothetical protein
LASNINGSKLGVLVMIAVGFEFWHASGRKNGYSTAIRLAMFAIRFPESALKIYEV